MKVIGIIVSTAIVGVIGAYLHAYLITKMYAWFICTAYGVPPIGMAHAYGIGALLIYLTHQDISELKEDNDDGFGLSLAKAAVKIIIQFLIFLGVSWFVYSMFIKGAAQ
jgi:hypothetical protein